MTWLVVWNVLLTILLGLTWFVSVSREDMARIEDQADRNTERIRRLEQGRASDRTIHN